MDELIWVLFSLIMVVLAVFGVWHFSMLHGDYHENRILTIMVGTSSLWLGAAKLVMAPADVYDIAFENGKHSADIKRFYQMSDMVTAVYCFVMLPFLYVFNSEKFASWRGGYRSAKLSWRIFISVLCLVPGLLVLGTIILLGIFIEYSDHNSEPIQEWLNATREQTDSEKTFNILSGACSIVGVPFMVFYLGSGLALIPLKLLERKLSTNELFVAGELLDEQLENENYNMAGIKSNYMNNLTKGIDKKDKKKFRSADKKIKELEETKTLLKSTSAESKFSPRKIARYTAGVLLLLFLCFNIAGILGGRIYALLNSDCGWRCAYVTASDSGWANPVDEMTSDMGYELATVFFACFTIYMMAGMLGAFVYHGFNFIFIEEALERYSSPAQAIYLECITLLLVTSALTPYLAVVAPRYAVFGCSSSCYFGSFSREISYPAVEGNDTETVSLTVGFEDCLTTELSKQVYSLRILHPIFSVADTVSVFGLSASVVFFLIWYFARMRGSAPVQVKNSSARGGYLTVTNAFDDVDDKVYV